MCVYVCLCMIKVKPISRKFCVLSVTPSPSSTRRKRYILYIAFTLRKIESTRVAIRSRIALNMCQQSVQVLPVTTASRLLTCDTLSGQQHKHTRTQSRG